MGTTESSVEGGAEARRRRQPYRCFLLRCRLEEGAGPHGEGIWRFTVQQAVPDAPRRSFACLHDVAAYLEAELGSSGQHTAGPEDRSLTAVQEENSMI